MKLRKFYKELLDYYPIGLQEEWDNSGLLIKKNKKIKRIVFALDVNFEVVDFAISKKADLIITHHPLYLIDDRKNLTAKQKQLIKLIKKNKLSLISMHTNFDNHKRGSNYSFIKKLEWEGCSWYVNLDNVPYGYIEDINKTTKEIINEIKTKFLTFKIKSLKKYNNNTVNKVYVCTGSGFSILKEYIASASSDELFITSDLKWHDWEFAKIHEANVIDIGHESEQDVVDFLEDIVKNIFEEEFLTFKFKMENPFSYN